jgi:hypothetical protein
MKEVRFIDLENREWYLVYAPMWSESGYDVAEYDSTNLIGSNGSPIPKSDIEFIYTLPEN